MNLVKGDPAARRGAATIGVRPEHIDLSKTSGEWPARVRLAEHLGSDTFVYADVDGLGAFTIRVDGEADLKPGDKVFLNPREDRVHKFDKDGLRLA